MIRIRHEAHGEHVRMRVFVGPDESNATLALAGRLCMRREEFAEFQRLAAGDGSVKVQFLREVEGVGVTRDELAAMLAEEGDHVA